MGNYIFDNINFFSKALDAYWLRDKAISNNIANVDTPNYKRKEIQFEELLKNEKDINVEPKEIVINKESKYRLDGNNVDIDIEMVNRAKNELKYNAVLKQVSHEFKMLNTVLRSK